MTVLLKTAAVAAIYITFSLILKSYRPEYVFFLRVCAVGIIIMIAAEGISDYVSELLAVISVFNIDSSHISLLLKAVGIALLSDFICDTLKDSGENSLAGVVSVSAKLIILSFTLPMISGLVAFCLKIME